MKHRKSQNNYLISLNMNQNDQCKTVLRNACIVNVHKGMKKVSRLTFSGKVLCCLLSMWPSALVIFFSILDQD